MSSDVPARGAVLTRDSSREAERLQVERWRSLPSEEIAQLVAGASRAALTMALAGLRERHPGSPEGELLLRMALLSLGPALAQQAYSAIDHLIDPRVP